ncbi:MAG TPA: hypothetical protein VM241_06475 [Candidatus Thermoplasmatota archaeon]|nr:hypothetical protein [Candidatus Thermoplasmatota archaeon]
MMQVRRVLDFLRRRLPEMALGLLLAGQLAYLLQVFPLSSRFFLNPDDYTAFQFARRLPQTLIPVLPYDLPMYSVSNYGIFGSQSALLNQDHFLVPRGPPGVFYLLAPFAAVSLDAANIGMMVLCAATYVALYAYLRPATGPWAALVGTCFFMFAPSSLFWSSFLLANVPAIGVLLLGLMLMRRPRPLVSGLGGLILCLSILFRYEYVVLVFAIGAFWVFRNLYDLRSRKTARLAVVGGVLVGLVLVVGLSWALYQTPNFVAATIKQGDSATETLANTVGTTKTDNIRDNFGLVATTFAAYLVATVALLWTRAGRRAELIGLTLGATILAVFFLGNTFTVTPFFFNRSLVRYFIPITLLGAMGVAYLFSATKGHWGVPFTIATLVIVSAVSSMVFASGSEGFGYAKEYIATEKEEIRQAELLAAAHPQTILIGEHSSKEFVDLPVIAPFFHLPDAIEKNETKRVVHELLQDGHHVYGLNRYAGDYRQLLSRDSRFLISPSGQPLYWEVSLV